VARNRTTVPRANTLSRLARKARLNQPACGCQADVPAMKRGRSLVSHAVIAAIKNKIPTMPPGSTYGDEK